MAKTQQLTRAIRCEFLREVDSKSSDDQPQEWDSDEEDEHDEEELDQRMIGTFTRAWAAWNIAEEALEDDPETFGPMSFGFIALGAMLEVIKKQRMDY